MAVLNKKADFFWSGEALDQWENTEEQLSRFITDEATAVLEENGGNTVNSEEMKVIIKKALARILRDA